MPLRFGHVVLYLSPNFTWFKGEEIQCNFLGAEGRMQSTGIMAAQDKMSAHDTIELILGILPCPLFSKVRGQFYLGGFFFLDSSARKNSQLPLRQAKSHGAHGNFWDRNSSAVYRKTSFSLLIFFLDDRFKDSLTLFEPEVENEDDKAACSGKFFFDSPEINQTS